MPILAEKKNEFEIEYIYENNLEEEETQENSPDCCCRSDN